MDEIDETKRKPVNAVEEDPEKEDEDLNLEGDVSDEDPYAIFAVSTEMHERQEKSEKDLNSPDSNDSGIQADAQSFQHLSDDLDLYAVVKKPKRKVAATAVDEDCPFSSAATETYVQPNSIFEEGVVSPEDKEKKMDDLYATVIGNSGDEDDPTYTTIGRKTNALRIVEQSEETERRVDNGNHHLANYDGSSDDNDESNEMTESSSLPEGWQKHEDELGAYYWHIKSGITQREPPPCRSQTLPTVCRASEEDCHLTSGDLKTGFKVKDTPKLSLDSGVKLKTCKQSLSTSRIEASSAKQFLVHCLGSVSLGEEELSDDRSGLTINKCISTLSRHPGSLPPGKLQGRDLYLDFVGDQLVLTDVHKGSVVSSESIKSVRVWGVGRDKDSREFAYVARDSAMEKHVCWVFACERTGHEIASTLRNVCYKILKENDTHAEKTGPASTVPHAGSGGNHLVHSSNISREWQKSHTKNWNENVVFPVPMNEPKKVINCRYLGMMKVPKPTGMHFLNDAIEMIYAGVPNSKWVSVSVEVAPSAVTVYDRENINAAIFECRIRFLTFLGICINNCRLGAFIMHSAQNEFFAHVFYCNPDAGLFCKTIKAACKLRYQKCLDAQAQKEQDRGKVLHQMSTRSLPPFQGMIESLQKGVNSLRAGNKKQKG